MARPSRTVRSHDPRPEVPVIDPRLLLRCVLPLWLLLVVSSGGIAWWAAGRVHGAEVAGKAALARAGAYRSALHDLSFESPADYALWAQRGSAMPSNAVSFGALAAADLARLAGVVTPAERRSVVAPTVADHIRYRLTAQRYVRDLIEGQPAAAGALGARELQPHFLAMTSRLNAGAARWSAAAADAAGQNHLATAYLRLDTLIGVPLGLLSLAGMLWLLWRRREEMQLLAEDLARLEAASAEDSVTGLPNERMFAPELGREVARASRQGTALTLALIEIDTAYGANATAEAPRRRLLAALATIVSGRRAEDRAFKLEGARFALLLPGTTAREVYPVLEGMRARAAGRYAVTLSTGAADVLHARDSAEALQRRAAVALAEAQHFGGNAVMVYAARAGVEQAAL